jgi:hypothetical protein
VGRLSSQAKPNEAKAIPTTVLDTRHISTWEPSRHADILIQAR